MVATEPRVGTRLTTEQFAQLEDTAEYRFELHEGRLAREPRPAAAHQVAALALASALREWSRSRPGREWLVLAIEVVSPSNTAPEIQRKVLLYLRNGVREVWIAYPDTRTVVVHRPDGHARTLGDGEILTGDELLPGLRLPVAEIVRVD